jgi:hypothetical protein
MADDGIIKLKIIQKEITLRLVDRPHTPQVTDRKSKQTNMHNNILKSI